MELLRTQFPDGDFAILGLVLLLPLIGAFVNGVFGKRLGNEGVRSMALAACGGAFVLSVVCFLAVVTHPVEGHTRLTWTAWEWFSVSGQLRQAIPIEVAFSVDELSGTMMLVVTGVGFLIHLYSTGYMAKDPGFYRFFAYLNLFIFSMLVLILGDNLAVLFIGWEGVGLCSYLLIGFWFDDAQKAAAGKKAFITNRIGDFGLLVAMAMLIYYVGTLEWGALERGAPGLMSARTIWPLGNLKATALPNVVAEWLTPETPIRVQTATLVAIALFIGCVGKSAQIPLYVWLPDAMAGPTPVSALIHAATMVTAGVYLVARCSFIFVLSPAAMAIVAGTGALTALLAASIAFTQNDLKKVLAYSTVSQLGFMFIGVGVGAFAAGFFHVITHAFFKGCLFLCAGSVIHAMHARIHDDVRSQDMRHMGGLRKYMPITHATFLISCFAIAGAPLTSGFFSKDEVLFKAFSNELVVPLESLWRPPSWYGPLIYAIGLVAALGTAFYMFRAYFMTFHGEFRGWKPLAKWRPPKDDHHHAHDKESGPLKGPIPHESPRSMTVPLVVLAALAAVGGFLYAEPLHLAPLEHFWAPVFERATKLVGAREGAEAMMYPLLGVGALVFFAGAGAAYWVYVLQAGAPARSFVERFPKLHALIYDKWRIDELYEATVIGLIDAMGETAAQFDKLVIDGIISKATAVATLVGGTVLRALHTGRVQAYAAAMVIGVAGIGWFVLSPHAVVDIDTSNLRVLGELKLNAASGHGYRYRWYAEGEEVPEAFTTNASYTARLRRCETKRIHVDVKNVLGRTTHEAIDQCREVIPNCCAPLGKEPPKLPDNLPGVPPELDAPPKMPRLPTVPDIKPGTHDAGVLQELLNPGGRPEPDRPEPPAPPQPGAEDH